MNSYFLYWDLSWIVIFLFTFENSLATKSNQRIYFNKRNISSTACYEKEPTHIPIENIKKELDELAEIERNIPYVRTSKLSGGPNKPIRYFYIDVVAIADYSLFLQFGRARRLLNPNINKSMIEVGIREEIANMFFGAKRVYLQNQFSISGMFDIKIVLNLVDIIIFESKEESFLTGIKEGRKVYTFEALKLLGKYARKLARKQPYDHVTLITGNDLVKKYGNTYKDIEGVAWVSTMCFKQWSSSIIEKKPEGTGMLHLVHEIAHSLGATHDGSNNCRTSDQYLMSPDSNAHSKTLNKWKFSECSREEIASTILRRLNGDIFDFVDKSAHYRSIEKLSKHICDCFTKKIPIQKSVPDVSRRFHGSEYEFKMQCAFSGYSDAGSRCDHVLTSRKSCLLRYCRGVGNRRWACEPLIPYRGTSCEEGKVCEDGYCRSIEELKKVKMDFSSDLTAPDFRFEGCREKSIRYFYIDVAAIADYSLFLQFGRAMSSLNPNINKSMIEVAIRDEIANLFFGAKRVYLQNQFSIPGMFDFKIVLNLVDIIIFESEEESFLTSIKEGDKVDSSKALVLLNKYAANRPYDHMTLLTGNDLVTKRSGKPDKHIAGITPMSFMCVNYKSISIIGKPLEGLSVLILVHEIGHALGANHDGQNNCRAEDKYLMYPKPYAFSQTLNKWKFSECSRKQIASNILRRLNGGIMDVMDKEKATDADIKELSKYMCDCFTKKIPIQKSVPDVSRRFRGSESELKRQCVFSGFSDAKNYCDSYLPSRKSCLIRFCLKRRRYCAPVVPYRGTSCGLGKVCENGYCRSIEELRKEKMDFSPNLTAPACGFEAQASSYCSHDYGLTLVIMTLLVCGTLTE